MSKVPMLKIVKNYTLSTMSVKGERVDTDRDTVVTLLNFMINNAISFEYPNEKSYQFNNPLLHKNSKVIKADVVPQQDPMLKLRDKYERESGEGYSFMNGTINGLSFIQMMLEVNKPIGKRKASYIFNDSYMLTLLCDYIPMYLHLFKNQLSQSDIEKMNAIKKLK